MMMWTTFMTGLLVILSSCNTGTQVNGNAPSNSTLLYKKDSLLTPGRSPAVVQCHFSKEHTNRYNKQLTTLLILEEPLQVQPAEGVYEVYLTAHEPAINKLSSLQEGFVSLLDLYSHTAPGAKNQIEIDISGHINKIFTQREHPLSAWISIRFAPIQLPDGNPSTNAGELHIKGLSIVQVKK